MVNYFQIFPPLVFSYWLFIFTNCGNFQSRTWVWRKFAAENRVKEGIGQESNGAANQEKKFSYFARSRLRLRPQEIWERDYGWCNMMWARSYVARRQFLLKRSPFRPVWHLENKIREEEKKTLNNAGTQCSLLKAATGKTWDALSCKLLLLYEQRFTEKNPLNKAK